MAEKSRAKREWIERVWADNPPEIMPNGNLRFLARTAFCNLLERPKNKQTGEEQAWGTVLLLPEAGGPVKFDLFQQAIAGVLKEHMPAALANEALRDKLNKPFKKQGSFIDIKDPDGNLYDGFVDGRFCISANSSQSKPYVVDINGAPIVDKSRIYSGCWVLASVKPDWIKNPQNPGPTFYLQGVMVVSDDESLGGVGGGDPKADFAGVKIDQAVNPAAMFGAEAPTPGEIDLLS